MTLYDVLLVNPVIDGMNLVSKEGPLVNNRDGVLILSELAGSFEQLQEFVLPVSPADLEGTVRALHQALTMPEDERRTRAEGLRKQVEDYDIVRWLEAQFKDLLALTHGTLVKSPERPHVILSADYILRGDTLISAKGPVAATLSA